MPSVFAVEIRYLYVTTKYGHNVYRVQYWAHPDGPAFYDVQLIRIEVKPKPLTGFKYVYRSCIIQLN